MEDTVVGTYFSLIEKEIIASAAVMRAASHGLNIGTPREQLIQKFVRRLFRSGVGIGTGELISFASRLRDPYRNQIDVVLHDERIPGLNLGEDSHVYLIESVKATIEVKSTLTKEGLHQAMWAGSAIEALSNLPQDATEALGSGPRKFLVAFDGPKRIETVFNWMEALYHEHGTLGTLGNPRNEWWLTGADAVPKSHVRSSTLDGIFVLGRGMILFDTFDLSFGATYPQAPNRLGMRQVKWSIIESDTGALLSLFLVLQEAINADAALFKHYFKAIRASSVRHAAMPPAKRL